MLTANNGVLVTNVDSAARSAPHLIDISQSSEHVKHGWEKHFSPKDWYSLLPEDRNSFTLKLLLSEMVVDINSCLVNNVASRHAESTK